MNIVWKGSPNFTKRTITITKIIIHWFAVGTLESANNRFQNPKNQVSAHYGISNGRVWQWVKEENVAFHSGNFLVNQTSIGIEHNAILNGHKLSEEDYKLSGQLVREIAARYNIPLNREHIIGHREVKPTACPGTISISKIIEIAKQDNSLIQKNMIVKEKGKPAIFAVVGRVLIPFLDWKSYQVDFKSEPIIELEASEMAKFTIAKANQITRI